MHTSYFSDVGRQGSRIHAGTIDTRRRILNPSRCASLISFLISSMHSLFVSSRFLNIFVIRKQGEKLFFNCLLFYSDYRFFSLPYFRFRFPLLHLHISTCAKYATDRNGCWFFSYFFLTSHILSLVSYSKVCL